MNKLSLFLYFADLLEHLTVIAVFGMVACFVVLVIGYSPACYDEYGPAQYPFFALSNGYHRTYVFLIVLSAIFVAVIPSTRTMYLIAASESAEVVVNSQEAKDAFALLKEALTKALKDKPSE